MKSKISEYKPRDFNTEIPILNTIGAGDYDQHEDMSKIDLAITQSMKKFQKDWKTKDRSKISYLMEKGIVQEVMKTEERKAIRRLAENMPKPAKLHNNQDLAGVQT